ERTDGLAGSRSGSRSGPPVAEPVQGLNLPVALRREPAPDAGARSEAICGVGLEDEKRVSHRFVELFSRLAVARVGLVDLSGLQLLRHVDLVGDSALVVVRVLVA